uniref:HEAT repeat domain-containing protein n=1 Tax=Streptomyces sp. NBC_00049 TaxID=2903617 RepID=A0AAU2JSB6_9ACTN
MAADLRSSDSGRFTRALLSLTLNDPDRVRMERILIASLEPDNDPKITALAVTCMGHLGRIHGVVSAELVSRLEALLDDPILGGQAEDALGDIASFAKKE